MTLPSAVFVSVSNNDSGTTLDSEQGQSEEENMKGLTVSAPQACQGPCQPAPSPAAASVAVTQHWLRI
jgi:hypothetical protein